MPNSDHTEPKYDGKTSQEIITQVAQDLAKGIAHPPPTDVFEDLLDANRTITLFQALPLSLSPEKRESIRTGETLSIVELNSAQQSYLQAMMRPDRQPTDFSSITVCIDPTHEKQDDHAHIVVEADGGNFGWHIDAFLAGTARPAWY